jgi:nucleoid-associated protein YgaU
LRIFIAATCLFLSVALSTNTGLQAGVPAGRQTVAVSTASLSGHGFIDKQPTTRRQKPFETAESPVGSAPPA